MRTVSVTLVTYTYDDHELVRGLLSSITGWTAMPSAIVVVDDGSAEPFTPDLPEEVTERLPDIEVLRVPENRGNTHARALGAARAATRFILSVDADIRFPAHWLAVCLPAAARPGVGMAGTAIRPRTGDDLLSRYLELTYTLNRGAAGSVPFLPGGAWLARRDAFEAVGGFSGYEERFGQDAYLSRRLRDNGYLLWAVGGVEAFEVRRIGRLQMVRRGWRWQGHHMKAALDEGRPLDEVLNVVLYSMRDRMLRSRAADPRLLYFDLLYALHALFDTVAHAAQTMGQVGGQGGAQVGGQLGGEGARAALRHSAAAFLKPWPQLCTALCADLAELGHAPLPTDLAAAPPFDLAAALSFAVGTEEMDAVCGGLGEVLG